MGKKGFVLKYFKELKQVGNKPIQFQCKFCSALYTKNVTRQAKHLLRCNKSPESVRNLVKSSGNLPETGGLHNLGAEAGPSTSTTVFCATRPSSSQDGQEDRICSRSSFGSPSNSMATFVDVMSNQEQAKLEEYLSRAIYATGAPLSMTENFYWKEFMKAIRPSFKLPSRYLITEALLTKEYGRVEETIKLKISEASSLALQCDAWSNLRNEAIINFIITTPSPVFYKTLVTGKERHTAENMKQEMKAVIEEIGKEKFLAVVTDNASAMVKARDMLSEDYGGQLSNYGCVAHTLNLLVGDILKLNSVTLLEAQAKKIVKHINNSQIILARFVDIQVQKKGKSLSLKLPGKPRWGSICFCLKSLLDTKYALKALAIADEDDEDFDGVLDNTIKRQLLDDAVFWQRIQKIHDLLNVIVKWITITESDKPRISKVVTAFKSIREEISTKLLEAPVTAAEEKLIEAAIEKRTQMALRPIHYAANILDPSICGIDLTPEQHVEAHEYIDELATLRESENDVAEILSDLARYLTKEGIWSKAYVWKSAGNLDAIVWWKGVCSPSKLSKLAADILSMPATSAATERSFSTYSFIHSAKRNRLTADNAGKITFVAHNLKLLRGIDAVAAQDENLEPNQSSATDAMETDLPRFYATDDDGVFIVSSDESGDENSVDHTMMYPISEAEDLLESEDDMALINFV